MATVACVTTPETDMFRLAFIIHFFVSTTLAGSLIVAVLVMGMDTWKPIVAAGLIGYALGLPVAVAVAKSMMSNQKT